MPGTMIVKPNFEVVCQEHGVIGQAVDDAEADSIAHAHMDEKHPEVED